jgi:hypothetical protein
MLLPSSIFTKQLFSLQYILEERNISKEPIVFTKQSVLPVSTILFKKIILFFWILPIFPSLIPNNVIAQETFKKFHVDKFIESNNECKENCIEVGVPYRVKGAFAPYQSEANPYQNRLTFSVIFREHNGRLPNFVEIIITDGTIAGIKHAVFYFDATNINSPQLLVYGFNGTTGFSSLNSNVIPILSSKNNSSNSWIKHLKVENVPTGTYENPSNLSARKFSFRIDATKIINFTPNQADRTPWIGTGWNNENFGTVITGTDSSSIGYDTNGWIKNLSISGFSNLRVTTMKITETCHIDCLGNEIEKGETPAVCILPTPTPTLITPTPLPTSEVVVIPTPMPTATCSPTPEPTTTVTTSGKCEEIDLTGILAKLDNRGREMSEIAKKAYLKIRKIDNLSKRILNSLDKNREIIDALINESWIEIWKIPVQAIISCDQQIMSKCISISRLDQKALLTDIYERLESRVLRIIRRLRRSGDKQDSKLFRKSLKIIADATKQEISDLPSQTLACN